MIEAAPKVQKPMMIKGRISEKTRSAEADHHDALWSGVNKQRAVERPRIGHHEFQRVGEIDRRFERLAAPGPRAHLNEVPAPCDGEAVVDRVVVLDEVLARGRRDSREQREQAKRGAGRFERRPENKCHGWWHCA